MKAIKFVILTAGVLGVVSFFLPYAVIDVGKDSLSFSALDVFRGVELASEGVSEAKKALETSAAEYQGGEEVRRNLKDIEGALDLVKGIIAVVFIPLVAFVLIGVIGAARGRLERVGGILALLLGLIGMGVNGLFLAAWGTAEVKAAGGSAGIAQYLLMIACTIGFVGGLLTVIRPDRGGRFG
jgi:hypothetical protein